MHTNLKGSTLHIGAAATLQGLLAAEGLPAALADGIRREPAEAQQAGVAAHLLAADGRSPLAAAMLALDAEIEFADGSSQGYGSLLALRTQRGEVASIRISTAARLDCYYEDSVWLALARWPAGRTRVAVGGWGAAPVLAMDGREPSGILEAAENALSGADEQRLAAVRRLAAELASQAHF